MLTQAADPFALLTEDPIERKILRIKNDFLVLLVADYDGGEDGVKDFAATNKLTEEQAIQMLTGQLSELTIDLLLSCIMRKGFDLSRSLVHESLMNLQLRRS